jgi:hypothetical protein
MTSIMGGFDVRRAAVAVLVAGEEVQPLAQTRNGRNY